ncbi:hypothetical protein B1M_44584 [Burkholderia sp. TJI49]|nr:hypothetical protein B1M_44584 [Burkholderia sp. TJI49]
MASFKRLGEMPHRAARSVRNGRPAAGACRRRRQTAYGNLVWPGRYYSFV